MILKRPCKEPGMSILTCNPNADVYEVYREEDRWGLLVASLAKNQQALGSVQNPVSRKYSGEQ